MINQTLTSSFKLELASAVHDFTADIFMLALYTSAASIGEGTTVYSVAGEVSGAGYAAGGTALTALPISVATNSAGVPTLVISFSPISWPSATFVARGALIYNSSKANRAVAVLDFGADKTAADTPFTVTFPAATADSAVITF